jgi:hypothetical protein
MRSQQFLASTQKLRSSQQREARRRQKEHQTMIETRREMQTQTHFAPFSTCCDLMWHSIPLCSLLLCLMRGTLYFSPVAPVY